MRLYINQKGFALIESTLILVVLIIISGTGYYVWHTKPQIDKSLESANTKDHTTPWKSKLPSPAITFDDCVKNANSNQAGAVLDDTGSTLNCYPHTNHPSMDRITHQAFSVVKTISALLTKPTFSQLPLSVKNSILSSSEKDCSNNKIRVDSPTDTAVTAHQAGNFIVVEIGCDDVNVSTYEYSDGNWKRITTINTRINKDDCAWIASEQYPIELLKSDNVPIAKCRDNQLIEHQVVVQ